MKYEILREDAIDFEGATLYRIRNEKTGELGGYIESEHNLSRYGKCWVNDNAIVFGNAQISGDAQICDYAQVYGHARVSDNAKISGDAQVYGYAEVYDKAIVTNDAQVHGDAKIYGSACICGVSDIYDYARVKDAKLSGCEINAHASIQGDILLEGIHIAHCTGFIEPK